MRRALILVALLWATPAVAQDSIPLATTVAPGGAAYRVVLGGELVDGAVVGGDTWSIHQRLDTAKDEAQLYVIGTCRWACPQIWVVPSPLRVDIHAIPYPLDAPAPEPDPGTAVWTADSITVYPADVEPSDSLRVTDLHWAAGTSYSCVTIAGETGYAEARPQEVDGIPYWILIPGDPAWIPPPTIDGWESVSCAPSMATLAELPTEDQAAYRVGLLADLPPEPIPVSPVVEYANSTLTATWEPSPSEWVDRYTITYGAQDGTGTTGAWTTATEYTVSTEITAGWICVRASRGGELSEQRCNSWDTGGG